MMGAVLLSPPWGPCGVVGLLCSSLTPLVLLCFVGLYLLLSFVCVNSFKALWGRACVGGYTVACVAGVVLASLYVFLISCCCALFTLCLLSARLFVTHFCN